MNRSGAELDRLVARMQEIVASERNQQNKRWWQPGQPWNRDMWRGVARSNDVTGGVPLMIAPDNAMWSSILGVDLREYYSEARAHLETQLRMNEYHFDRWHDETYFSGEVSIWFGVITELSYFGADLQFFPNREAWIKGPVINSEEDLARMTLPDFYKSGLMPRIHRFYEEISELLAGRLPVMFPTWNRGPFCIAAHLRGMENILVDMLINPDFVHRLMRFIVDTEKAWVTERAKFLNQPIAKGKIYDDEIDSPTLRPKLYDEFILPYEIELAEFYGGLNYWHSCGNTTPFYGSISMLPGLDMFHVGPWSDVKKADETFGPDVALDVCLNPQADVLEAGEEQMRQKVASVISAARGVPLSIRADGFMVVHSVEEDVAKIDAWLRIAQELSKA